MLDAGADATHVSGRGDTALHGAASRGHAGVVKLLLDSGKVDVGMENEDGYTAWSWAVEESQQDVAQLLKSAGAKLIKPWL